MNSRNATGPKSTPPVAPESPHANKYDGSGQLGTQSLCKPLSGLERALPTLIPGTAEDPPGKSAKYFSSRYPLKPSSGKSTLRDCSMDAAAREYLEKVRCLSRYTASLSRWCLVGLRTAEIRESRDNSGWERPRRSPSPAFG